MLSVAPDMTYEASVGWDRESRRHRVVFIHYENRKPCSVTTHADWDHSQKPWFNPAMDISRGTCRHEFDFDWCRRDKTLYFHESGMGGSLDVSICPFATADPPQGEIWVARGVTLVRWVSTNEPAKVIESDAELLAMGYRRLAKPRMFRGTRNPFEMGCEADGRTIYCRWCDDHLPDDWRICQHLRWCDECSDWFHVETGENVDDEQWICKCEAETLR